MMEETEQAAKKEVTHYDEINVFWCSRLKNPPEQNGNNIPNVNTVGYKTQNVTFTDVFYQTVQAASGPNAETGKGGTNAKQIGIGSALGTIATNVSKQEIW